MVILVADVVAMLTRRCAWCHRVFTAKGWAVAVASDDQASREETDTLCPDCAQRLQHRPTE
jgi:hypothetical protein